MVLLIFNIVYYVTLISSGLFQSAASLKVEGELPRGNTPPNHPPESPYIYASSSTTTPGTPKLVRIIIFLFCDLCIQGSYMVLESL